MKSETRISIRGTFLRKLLSVCLVSLFCGPTSFLFAAPRPTPTRQFNWPAHEKDKLFYVEIKSHLPPAEKKRIVDKLKELGLTSNQHKSEGWNVKVTNGASAKRVYEQLKGDPAVVYVEPFLTDNWKNFFLPTPTPAPQKPFPTPDWNKLVPGKDYWDGVFSVKIKPNLSLVEKKRVMEKLSSIGKVKPSLPERWYVIKITSGISVRGAIEEIKNDPAVESAGLEAKGHLF